VHYVSEMTATGDREGGVSDQVRNWIRKHARKPAKYVVVALAPLWDPIYVALFRRRSGWQEPVPPFNNRRKVAAWRIPYFLSSGKANSDDLVHHLERSAERSLASLDVLDLACGPGRIAMHFDGVFKSLTACDVDPSAIAFIQKHFSAMHATVNQSRPPLPFGDAQFDAVYSWSLWTHLPVDLQRAYLEELRRVLRPNGLALVTVNGHTFLDEYQAYPGAEKWWLGVTHEDLRNDGMIYHEFDFLGRDRTNALTGVTASFGLSFHDPSWISNVWNDVLEVVAHEEGALSNNQDLVLLRKR
jgi:SAM-dependent methyltransferase